MGRVKWIGVATYAIAFLILFEIAIYFISTSPAVYAQAEETLVLAYGNEVDSFNPLMATATAAFIVFNLVYSSTLGYVFNNGTLIPWTAESWSVSPDARVYEFKIKKGIMWHDGKPFTADDVAFTFELAKKYGDKTANPIYTLVGQYIDKVEKLDDYTVRVTLTQSYIPFLMYAATMYILPKHKWEKIEDPITYPNDNPIGVGPYKFVSRTPGVKYVLRVNEDFFMGRPAIENVVIQIIKDPQTRILSLKKGEIDATVIDPVDVSSLVGDPNVLVLKYPIIPTATVLGFNLRNYPLNIKEFRHVVTLMLDKEEMVQQIQFGFAEFGSDGYIQASWKEWAHPDAPLWIGKGMTPEERKKRAEEILESLGFIDRDGDGVRETPNGTKLEFDLWTLAEYSDYISAAFYVQRKLGEIGIKINVIPMATQTVIQRVYYGPPFEYDLYFMGIGYLPDPDNVLYVEFFGDPPVYGWTAYAEGYNNTELNELLLQQQKEGDVEKRREIIWRIQEILADDLPVIVLYHTFGLAARRTDRYTGWIDEEGVYSPLVIINLKPIVKQPQTVIIKETERVREVETVTLVETATLVQKETVVRQQVTTVIEKEEAMSPLPIVVAVVAVIIVAVVIAMVARRR